MLVLVSALALAGCQTEDEEDPVPTFTVSFSTGEGSGTQPGSMTAQSGSTITLPGQGSMTAPAGKSFKGWSDGSGTYNGGGTYTVTKTVTLTAQWGADTPTGHKVTVKHFAEAYQDEIISKVAIYEYDSTKSSDYYKGDLYQQAFPDIEYGKNWSNGLISKIGKYVVEITVGANKYFSRYTLELYDLTGETILSYNGYNLVKQ
jgi:hypothetical protein